MCFYDDISAIRKEYPDVRLDISFDEHEYLKGKKLLVLDVIEVPKEMRKRGVGTAIMRKLVHIADQYNCVFMLSPDESLGATSRERLRRFYKRFGFIDNKGRHKKYSLPWYSMYYMK